MSETYLMMLRERIAMALIAAGCDPGEIPQRVREIAEVVVEPTTPASPE